MGGVSPRQFKKTSGCKFYPVLSFFFWKLSFYFTFYASPGKVCLQDLWKLASWPTVECSLHSDCGIITVKILLYKSPWWLKQCVEPFWMKMLCWPYATQNLIGLWKFLSGCRKAQADHNRWRWSMIYYDDVDLWSIMISFNFSTPCYKLAWTKKILCHIRPT